MYLCKWFKDKEEAKKYHKSHGGAFYRNEPYSRTKKDHLEAAAMFGFDPNEFKYSVNWNNV